ncbi:MULTISPECIES: hypothetical protein [Brachybacterium]|uniref:Uncharacterized protein n=1 Tax=Brachybacterium kimchii TaxID=2942909 RepID=A0ABY4NB06_9MICO|nr:MULTISPECIES: hypothetical protein [Brachybacterium]MCG7309713.1 hypothetical protein [Brachybacterium sp. ACRRE]UQN30560.1 hypothetical protein M4486_04405 [Brachybacterium kimchii]
MTGTDTLREQIRDEVEGIVIGSGYYSIAIGIDAAGEVADAVLAVVQPATREEKAEAWNEGHEIGWLNADERWRCDGSIPAYYKAETTPNPYRDERSTGA